MSKVLNQQLLDECFFTRYTLSCKFDTDAYSKANEKNGGYFIVRGIGWKERLENQNEQEETYEESSLV